MQPAEGGEQALHRQGLWVSDGTPEGTRKVSEAFTPGPYHAWASFASRIYLAASDDLYVTDGTEAGTHPLRTAGGQPVRRVRYFLPMGSRLLMLTTDAELWQTNGTEAGTTLVRDLSPTSLPFDGLEMIRAGSRAFFPAWAPETGWELWALEE